MAHEQPGFSRSFNAEADLSAFQFTLVDNTNATGLINTPGADGAPCVGILQDKPAAAGRPGNVMMMGVSKCKFGAALTPGLQIMAEDATGLAIVATVGLHAVGIVLIGAGDTETGTVFLYGANVAVHA